MSATTIERYIPGGSRAVTGPGTTAVCHVREVSGRFCAMGYRGKSRKPSFNYSFRTEAQRDQYVAEWLATQARSEQARTDRKAEEKAKRAAFVTSLQVGSILVCSWGYEQTNVDFYEVTAVLGKACVEIREIGQDRTETQSMAGYCTPKPGAFIGEPMRKRVGLGDRLTMTTYSSASLWDGKPDYWSSYA